MTGRDLIIDVPGRRSRWLCWRDRCLTCVLWGAWGRPVDALARFAIGPISPDGGPPWDTFLRDLVDASSTMSILIVLLYVCGGYQRYQRRPTRGDTTPSDVA